MWLSILNVDSQFISCIFCLETDHQLYVLSRDRSSAVYSV